MSVQIWKAGITAMVLAATACSGGTEADDEPDSMAQEQMTGIEGAWRVAVLKLATTAAVNDPAGLYVFTPGHYSVIYSLVGSRPTFARGDSATQAEKVSAYDTFVANAGTYVVVGDTLIVRPAISRNPNYMGGGEDKFVLRVSGDTAWLASVPGAFRWASGQNNAATSSDSVTLVRAPSP